MFNQDRKWEFYIDGDSMDFRYYSEHFISSYFDISGGIDHYHDCINDDFRLKSAYFEDESDPEIVWQIGYELASLYNGATSIFSTKTIKLDLNTLLYNGVKLSNKPKKRNTYALLGKPNISEEIYNLEFEKTKEFDTRLFLIIVATERADVYLILKYFDSEPNYINFYKILETLESLSKSTGINIIVDESQRKAFKNTANNYSLSGLDSRHGFKKTIKDNTSASMNLDEAHTFLSEIAKQYLNNLLNGIIHGQQPREFKI